MKRHEWHRENFLSQKILHCFSQTSNCFYPEPLADSPTGIIFLLTFWFRVFSFVVMQSLPKHSESFRRKSWKNLCSIGNTGRVSGIELFLTICIDKKVTGAPVMIAPAYSDRILRCLIWGFLSNIYLIFSRCSYMSSDFEISTDHRVWDMQNKKKSHLQFATNQIGVP